MKKSFQLTAIAIAVSLSASVYADVNVTDPSNVNVYVNDDNGSYGSLNVFKGAAGYPSTQLLVSVDDNLHGGTRINTNTTINGNLAVNGGSSNIISAGIVATGADLIIPTVNPAFSSTTQNFAQNRVDTQNQTRSVDTQVVDANKFQLTTSEQQGAQSWTTSQSATAQYDANGVIIPGSLTGPVLGATVDNDFVASSVNKVQDLTLGRNNTSEDYRLSITKTDNGVTNTTNVAATGITTSRINGNGAGGALVLHGGTTSTTQTLDDSGVSFVTTDIGGNVTGTTTIDANGNLVVKGRDVLANLDQGDAATLTAANTYTDGQVAAEAAVRIQDDANTLAAANTYTDGQVVAEAAARQAGDTAIRNDIATKVTTNALEVNGSSTFNGPVTVNGTVTATKVATSNLDLGTNSNTTVTNTAPSANRLTARYDTTDANGGALTVYETQSGGVSTYYTITNGVATEFTTASVIDTLGTTVAPVAGGTTNTQSVLNTTTATIKQVTSTAVTYGEVKTQQDAVTVSGTLNNGQAIAVNVGTGAPVEVNNQSVVSGIIGQDANGNNIYGTVATAKTTDTSGTVTSNSSTTLTATGVSVADVVTGASTIVAAGSVTTGVVNADSVIVAGKNVADEFTRVDSAAAAEKTRVNGEFATATTDRAAIRSEAAAEKTRVNGEFAAATTDRAAIRSEAAVEKTRVNGEFAAATTDRAAIRSEVAAETTRVNSEFTRVDTAAAAEKVRVNTALTTETNARIAGDAATLVSANAYTDTRASQLNRRVDEVEKTSYRGIAIALAAQQQVPNIKPGQFAVFGGVGHYEGESAGALGVVGALNDRTSFSAALGFAGGNEIGGRVGVAYVFGGN